MERAEAAGERRGRGRLHDPDPVGSRRRSRSRAPIPSLLATAGVHHHLVREGTRTRCALVVESGDAREVHHCALLLGYGAGVGESVPRVRDARRHDPAAACSSGITHEQAVDELHQGAQQGHPQGDVEDGHLDAAELLRRADLRGGRPRSARSSTSTSRGRRRASAASASTSSPRKCRSGTERAFPARPARRPISNRAASTSGGATASTTCSTRTRCSSCSTRRAAASTRSSRNTRGSSTIRASSARRCAACSSCKPAAAPIPIDEVEPVESIVKRFATGAMSYGSISQEAHETLAIAMNRLGGKSNTGEGGEDPARYMPRRRTATRGAARSSRWRRRASASRASTSSTPTTCRSRWRRAPSPAKAASCPATRSIRGLRRCGYATPGVGLISPPPHHDIYSIEDLAQLIYDLKNANPDGADLT